MTDIEGPTEYRRPALGQLGSLGDLYDARADRILSKSILKSKTIPTEAIESLKTGGLVYKYTNSDSLEEKLSNLDMTADLSISVVSGLLKCDLAANYLMKKKSKDHSRQASTFCTRKTQFDTLWLDRVEAEYLNLNAVQTAGATHVITGIEWGAQTIVTAKATTKIRDERQHIGGKPPEDYSAEDTKAKKVMTEGPEHDSLNTTKQKSVESGEEKCKDKGEQDVSTRSEEKEKLDELANTVKSNQTDEKKKSGMLDIGVEGSNPCLLYTSPSPRDRQKSRMPSSA